MKWSHFFVFAAGLFFAFTCLAKNDFKTISMNEVEKLIKERTAHVYIYDVNVESTRKNVGILPNAMLLDSDSDYKVNETLPKDKSANLIFYCANQMCSSSHIAAKRAMAAGYMNVAVMTDGVYGWQKAGKVLVPASNARMSPSENGVEISPKEANDLSKNGRAVIVDVRESEERHEVVPGALWFPMGKMSEGAEWEKFKSTLPKGKVVIFHCAAGYRSKKAAEKLAAEGGKSFFFKGVDQWHQAGLPVSTRTGTVEP